jgi:hypothetical protein
VGSPSLELLVPTADMDMMVVMKKNDMKEEGVSNNRIPIIEIK